MFMGILTGYIRDYFHRGN